MTPLIKQLGLRDYLSTYEAMKSFTESRTSDTLDEIWVLQHPPTYTLGQAGDPSHLLNANTEIPLVSVNRGGQITYHGPGQIVVYLLLDLKRRHLFVRELVHKIEQTIIDTLADSGIVGTRKSGAPGIYLSDSTQVSETLVGAKIAALGLKVTKQCCYHGLALNVDMDLKPFEAINPCGYAGLKTIDMKSLGVSDNIDIVAKNLLSHLSQQLEVRS